MNIMEQIQNYLNNINTYFIIDTVQGSVKQAVDSSKAVAQSTVDYSKNLYNTTKDTVKTSGQSAVDSARQYTQKAVDSGVSLYSSTRGIKFG